MTTTSSESAAALAPPEVGRSGRRRAIVCIAVVLAAMGYLAVRGLTGSLVYYLTPTDVVVHHKASVGERIRLGGLVLPDTVAHRGSALTFTVSDGTTRVGVVDTGNVPELFKAGQGVVLEGSLGTDGRFHSDTVLVKHNGDYRPPPAGQVPRQVDVSGTG